MSKRRQQQLTMFQETYPLEQQEERLAIQLNSALELIQRISYLNIYQNTILGKYVMFKQEQIKKEIEQQLVLGIDPFDASARINEQILKGWLIESEQLQLDKFARDGNTDVDIDFIENNQLYASIKRKEQQSGQKNDLQTLVQLLTDHLQPPQPTDFQYGPQSQQDQMSQAQSQQQLLQNDTEQDQEEIKEEPIFNGQELLQQLNQQQQQQIFLKAKLKKVDFNETRSDDTTRQMIQPARQRQQQQNDEDLTTIIQGNEAGRVPRGTLNRSIMQDETQLRARSPIEITTTQNILEHFNDIESFASQVIRREQMPRTRAPSQTFEKISDIVQEEEKKQLIPENENIDDFQDALQDLQTPQEKEIEARNKQIDERIRKINEEVIITQDYLATVEQDIKEFRENKPLLNAYNTYQDFKEETLKELQAKLKNAKSPVENEQLKQQINEEKNSIPIEAKLDGNVVLISSKPLAKDITFNQIVTQKLKEEEDYIQIMTGVKKNRIDYILIDKERIEQFQKYIGIPPKFRPIIANKIKDKLKKQATEFKSNQTSKSNPISQESLTLANEYLQQIMSDIARYKTQDFSKILENKIKLEKEKEELSAKKGITLTNA